MKVIGKPRRRVDGRAKVTGQTRFADDIVLPRMLHMKLLRSPHAHALIEEMDTEKAKQYPGVHLVLTGKEPSETLRKELVAWVRKDIGPIASPDLIQFAPGLPKTRSGKIMRRILRKIAEDEPGSLGDTSTLADPAVVDDLVQHRQNKKDAPA